MTVAFGVLASGTGSNLQAILDACAAPGFPARVACVVSDRRDARALERARAAGIPAYWVPRRRPREEHEADILERLADHGCEWVALAGYMRLLGPAFLRAFPDRVLNVHPALLPAFPGLDAVRRALEAGVRVTGATVHLVDDGVDTGPIVAQGAVPVLPGDDEAALHARIHAVEHRLYPAVVRIAAEGRLRVEGGRAVVDLRPGEALSTWFNGAPGPTPGAAPR